MKEERLAQKLSGYCSRPGSSVDRDRDTGEAL